MHSQTRVAAALVLASLTLTACGVPGIPRSREEKAAQDHANTAGAVMLRGYAPIPTRYAAAQITGDKGPARIEALTASGTTWAGEVVLRITVQGSGSLDSPGAGVGCFRYTFRHRLEDAHPHRLENCPHSAALRLPDADSLPVVTERSRAIVARTLSQLSASQQRSAQSVAVALRSALGAAYQVVTFVDDGRVGLKITAADTCLLGHAYPIDLGRVLSGLDCSA